MHGYGIYGIIYCTIKNIEPIYLKQKFYDGILYILCIIITLITITKLVKCCFFLIQE